MTFKKGDKVKLIEAQDEMCAGATGTVWGKSGEHDYDVVLDKKTVQTNDGSVWSGHNGDTGKADVFGHWYVEAHKLRRICAARKPAKKATKVTKAPTRKRARQAA